MKVEKYSFPLDPALTVWKPNEKVQITSERPRCGQCVDVDRVIFAVEVDESETGDPVPTGNKAIFLTEGGEPKTNRYNFIERESN